MLYGLVRNVKIVKNEPLDYASTHKWCNLKLILTILNYHMAQS
jgi:hypothetical protein